MNLLEDIVLHLADEGLGIIPDAEQDGNLFYGHMPDKPDLCICVFCTDSGKPGSSTGARIQIVTRAKDTRTAFELSESIRDALDEFSGFLHGDGPQVSIEVINASAGLGPDESKREIYSSNYVFRYCG